MTTTTQAKALPSIGNRSTMTNKTPGLPVQLLTAGSAACVADLITFPLDTAKVRLQVRIKHYKQYFSISLRPKCFFLLSKYYDTFLLKHRYREKLFKPLIP